MLITRIMCCLTLAVLAANGAGQTRQVETKQYARKDLPCGHFIRDPNRPDRVVYFGGLRGMAISYDCGQTFTQRATPYPLKLLYVHPKTAKLFAIAEYVFTDKNPHTGKPWVVAANKILASDDDGKTWRDISGKRGRIGRALYLFQDPDHPERVCVFAETVRGNILQAVDDDYSDWKWFMETSWLTPTPKDDFNYPKEICPRFEKPQ